MKILKFVWTVQPDVIIRFLFMNVAFLWLKNFQWVKMINEFYVEVQKLSVIEKWNEAACSSLFIAWTSIIHSQAYHCETPLTGGFFV